MALKGCCGGTASSKSILKGLEYKLPQNLSVTEYFHKCILESRILPEAPAIIGEDGSTVSYTFSMLDSLSTKLAKALRRYLGFWTCANPDGDLVMAFCLPVSDIIPIVILAILKLGAAFLAIPIGYQEQFIVKIVSVARPMIVITESTLITQARFHCVSGLVTLVNFEEIMSMAMNGGYDDVNEVFPLETLTQPFARIASIVFTAGTMDQQLAVRVGHFEILNRCLWQYKEFPYVTGEVQALTTGLEDIDSIVEIFAPLLAGSPLHIIERQVYGSPPNLISRIQLAKITRLTLSPPVLETLLTAYQELSEEEKSREPLKSLKFCTISGDAMSSELVEKFFSVLSPEKLLEPHHHHPIHHHRIESKTSKYEPTVMLIHLYGSTEVMSDVTFETFVNCSHLENKFKDDKVSIGRPIGNTILYIVDEDMRLVETGRKGEICIAGAAVASGGYASGTDKDDLERFSTNPFTKQKGFTTIYQTEDFGRIHLREGIPYLFYEGRTEMIAKVKGKRVDLRDIAKLVNETKLIEKCTALCFHPGKIDQAIVAVCILLPGVTQKELEGKLRQNIKEEHLIPQIFPVEEFHYLPSGRLDKHRFLKQYLYHTMNATSEEWQKVVGLTPQQKGAAKVLFSAIAKYTKRTLRQVMDGHKESLWSLGVNSLNALSIFLYLRDSSYLINIDTFLKATNLLQIVEAMKTKTKSDHPPPNLQRSKLYAMPHDQYYAEALKPEDKENVINLISKSYAGKNDVCTHLNMSTVDFSKFLLAQWKQIVRDDLSLVAYAHSGSGIDIVGAVIVVDASGSLKTPKHCHQSIKYWIELINSTDKAPKEHIVWKKKGTVAQIVFLGTAETIVTNDNIMIVALLLEAAKVGAKAKGYDGIIVSGSNTLLTDLCEGILNYKVLEEVPIYKFRAKDKTLPYRLLAEHKTVEVLYESF